MIQFNTVDYNLDDVEKIAKMNKMKTYVDYRVYGLSDTDKNPPILIEYNPHAVNQDIKPFQINELQKFFKFNDILLRFRDDKDTDKKQVWIGLRRDLRDNPEITAACVKTIIFYLEGKLALDTKFTVPGIPLPRSRR